MESKDLLKAISTVMTVVIFVVISALVVGSILANTVFSSITIINVTELQNEFGSFVSGLIAFLAIIGTLVGIVWLIFYVKKLFDKKSGLQGMTA